MSAREQNRTAAIHRSPWHWLVHAAVHGSNMTRRKRRTAYLLTVLAGLAAIWTPVLVLLMLVPATYTSNWSLILPGSGAGHAVSLDSVGQANATVSSPYTSHSVDPKANTKAIAMSDQVIAAAAARAGLHPKAFGKPKIKLVDQTALMHFRVQARSANEAQRKSQALYRAILAELDRLRLDETRRREQAIEQLLANFDQKLSKAQLDVRRHQVAGNVVSVEQFQEMTMRLEGLRGERVLLATERAALEGRVAALEDALGLTADQAGVLLMLQRDVLLQKLLEDRAEASGALAEASARWGPNHPRVVSARASRDRFHEAVFRRASEVATLPVKDYERWIVAAGAELKASHFDQLVSVQAELEGVNRRFDELDRHITEQEALLEATLRDAAVLEDLTRRRQVATAVFTTALAKVDISKSDPFASYPLVQLLAAPTLPDSPDRMATRLAIGGGIIGSLFFLIGLTLLWIRKPQLRRILKSA